MTENPRIYPCTPAVQDPSNINALKPLAEKNESYRGKGPTPYNYPPALIPRIYCIFTWYLSVPCTNISNYLWLCWPLRLPGSFNNKKYLELIHWFLGSPVFSVPKECLDSTHLFSLENPLNQSSVVQTPRLAIHVCCCPSYLPWRNQVTKHQLRSCDDIHLLEMGGTYRQEGQWRKNKQARKR